MSPTDIQYFQSIRTAQIMQLVLTKMHQAIWLKDSYTLIFLSVSSFDTYLKKYMSEQLAESHQWQNKKCYQIMLSILYHQTKFPYPSPKAPP